MKLLTIKVKLKGLCGDSIQLLYSMHVLQLAAVRVMGCQSILSCERQKQKRACDGSLIMLEQGLGHVGL